MTQCQHCTRKTTLPLCTPCAHNLQDILKELPWLLHQLDITITRQDHLHTGDTHATTHNPSPINVGAMELMRQTSKTLHTIALDIAEIHGSERIPALVNATPTQVAYWLAGNLNALQTSDKAGEHYEAIQQLVGDTQPGTLHAAINRHTLHFAGPCPTTRTHTPDGTPLYCGTMLWHHDDQTSIECPRCHTPVDIDTNKRRTITLNDTLPAPTILEELTYSGVTVRPETFYGWITSGKLPFAGMYLTAKGRAQRPLRPSDPRLYSYTAAQQLAATRQTTPA